MILGFSVTGNRENKRGSILKKYPYQARPGIPKKTTDCTSRSKEEGERVGTNPVRVTEIEASCLYNSQMWSSCPSTTSYVQAADVYM